MKTTVEISDPLLREARKLAEREGVTLRALVERGLRRVVTETSLARRSSSAGPASRARGCRPTCAARPGAGCAIWPTKVAGLDRCRHEHSGLCSPGGFPVSRSSGDANCGTRGRIRNLVDPLAMHPRVSRHRHPSPHLCAADALAAGFRPSGRLARVADPRAPGQVGGPLAGLANNSRKGTNCRTPSP